MATKAKKTSSKKTTETMRDLPARKNPKGGAQKKEGENLAATQKPGSSTLGARGRQKF